MKHSPLMRFLGMFTWLVTSLSAINTGARTLGYDFWNIGFVAQTLGNIKLPVHYLVGICGVISLIMFIMCLTDGCGDGCSKPEHQHHH